MARHLSGPGVLERRGGFVMDAELIAALERGLLRLEVFTRQHPFGAARAVLALPE